MRIDYDLGMKWNDRLKQAFDAAVAARGIKQTDLADACGVADSSVTDWFNGETKSIKSEYLIPACRFLEVSPFWVILGDDTQYEFAPTIQTEQIGAGDTIRLITAYAQTDDAGRALILNAAAEARKSFPRG